MSEELHAAIHEALRFDDPRVRHRAVLHPAVTAEHLAVAMRDESDGVRGAAVRHPLLPENLARIGLIDESSHVRAAAVYHESLTHDSIAWALAEPRSIVEACGSLLLTEAELDTLASDVRFTFAVLRNPKLGSATIDRLAGSLPETWQRAAHLGNTSTSTLLWLEYETDLPSGETLGHRNMPERERIRALRNEDARRSRTAVALMPDPLLLVEFLETATFDHFSAAAGSPLLHPETAAWLYEKCTTDLSTWDSVHVLNLLAENDATPAGVLEAMLRHPDLASDALGSLEYNEEFNKNTDLLHLALAHDDVIVRQLAVYGPAVTPDLLRQAMTDAHEWVRSAAAFNPYGGPEASSQGLLDDEPRVRASAAQSDALPPELLEVALRDPEPMVRAAAIKNDNITLDQMLAMKDDPSQEVQKVWAQFHQRLRCYEALERLGCRLCGYPIEDDVTRHRRESCLHLAG